MAIAASLSNLYPLALSISALSSVNIRLAQNHGWFVVLTLLALVSLHVFFLIPGHF